MSETLILVNPQARHGDAESHWPSREKEILKVLGKSSVHVVFTSATDHGRGAVKQALRAGATQIIVVGGDGTLSESLQGFFDENHNISPDATLVVMPGGRGDDFFKSLTRERYRNGQVAWEKALEVLKDGTPAPIDIGHLSWIGSLSSQPRYFLNIASFGFPGLVVERVQKRTGFLGKSFLGKSALAYSAQGAAALASYQPLEVEVKVDERTFFDGKIHSGFILNGLYNGGGICWDKYARLNDGLFSVTVMEYQGTSTYLSQASKIMLGVADSIPGVFRAQGKKIEVLFKNFHRKDHPFFEVDGDLFEDHETRGAVFEVIPRAIRVQMA